MRSAFNVLFLLMITSCNNNKTESTTSSNGSAASTAEEPRPAPGGTGRCASLYLFREGTLVENVSYDGEGKEISKQVSKVLTVGNQGGMMTAEVEMKSTGSGADQTLTGKYSCDGNNLYVDLTSLFANMETKGAKIEGDAITFPINLSEGQTLPDATYSFTISQGGNKQMKMTSTIKDRKVEGRESVTTPAGTFDCYRITAEIETEMEMPGMDEKTRQMMKDMKRSMPKQKFTMFFDPAVSIIKVLMHSDDKLVSRSEITSIKN
jgi:hypothetical protein